MIESLIFRFNKLAIIYPIHMECLLILKLKYGHYNRLVLGALDEVIEILWLLFKYET